MNGRCAFRPARAFWLLGALILSTPFVAPVAANPLPSAALIVHVQTWDPDFCENNTVLQCEDAVQYTDLEGDLEFDLYLDNRFEMLPAFSEFELTAQWPVGWQFTSFESCSGGTVTLSPGVQQVGVQVLYPAAMSPGTWTYLGRFRMQVNGFGALDAGAFLLDDEYWGEVGPAQAGVECSYTFLDCHDLMPPCTANLDVSEVEMHVPQEGTGVETYGVYRGWDGMSPCSVQFMEAATWMELDVTWDQYGYEGVMTVTVNAAGMTPGVYPAVIRIVSQSVKCIPVTVYVEPVAAAPDPGPGTRAMSWGKVKRNFR